MRSERSLPLRQFFSLDVVAATHEAVCQLASCLLRAAPLPSFRFIKHDPGHASIFERRGRVFQATALNMTIRGTGEVRQKQQRSLSERAYDSWARADRDCVWRNWEAVR